MAYVTLTSFEILTGITVEGSQSRLQELTAEEETIPAYFSPEDIIRITYQEGYDSMGKLKGRFWNRKHQVWVGYDGNGQILSNVIALQCPPYYSPYAFPGVDISAQSNEIPEGFPPATAPSELS